MTRLFWLLVGLTTVARLLVIGRVGLAHEEAYHWNYAQHPDLSYFDHPPMVGWLIGLTGGDTEFWVRLPAVLLFIGSSWFVFDLGRRMFSPLVGLVAATMLGFLPSFAIFSVAMMPDSPHLFCWCAGLWAGWRLVESEDPRWWWLLGLITGLGMLSKYPAALIPLPALVLGRRSWQTAGAALLAMALFSPVLWWNATHDWASFLFQGSERIQAPATLMARVRSYLFQLLMMTPAGLALVVWAQSRALKQMQDQRIAYLVWSSLPFLALMVLVSLKRFVNINWPMPGYLGSILLMAYFLVQSWPASRLAATTLALFGVTLSYLPWVVALIPLGAFNPLDTFSGWRPVGEQIEAERTRMPEPERTFYLGTGYEAASQLAFTTRRPHHTLAQNALGLPNSVSYRYWEDPREFAGWDALIVADARHPVSNEVLSQHFARFEEASPVEIDRDGKPLRHLRLYRGYGFIPGPPP
ncbi:MAG: hypothetical protein AMXMBFR33_42170 [Candidatus Xenobia bacterium]